MKITDSESSGQHQPHRRCERRTASIRFSLCGPDVEGALFEEEVTTRNISDRGGCFSSQQVLRVGSTLRVSDSFGFISLIRIAWSREIPGSKSRDFGFWFENLLDS
jgi:hypothetical protein